MNNPKNLNAPRGTNNKITLMFLGLILLLIIVSTYFFHFNPNSKQASFSQNNSEQLASKLASDRLVEIFYLPHPPAEAIVDEVEKVLAKYPDFSVVKYDFTDSANNQKMQEYGLVDHTPVAIFINGTNTFKVEDRNISLVNFPRGDAFVPTLEGTWNYDDLDQILAEYN